MGENMRVSGKKGNSMEKESTLKITTKRKKEFG